MLASLTSEELTEWMAYHELEPWGEERADFRSGTICAVVANLMKSKDDRPARAADFVPDFDGSRKAGQAGASGQDAEEFRRRLRGLQGGGDEGGRPME